MGELDFSGLGDMFSGNKADKHSNVKKNNSKDKDGGKEKLKVTAPYNFIPFTDKVYEYSDEKIIYQDKINDTLLINYRMVYYE